MLKKLLNHRHVLGPDIRYVVGHSNVFAPPWLRQEAALVPQQGYFFFILFIQLLSLAYVLQHFMYCTLFYTNIYDSV